MFQKRKKKQFPKIGSQKPSFETENEKVKFSKRKNDLERTYKQSF